MIIRMLIATSNKQCSKAVSEYFNDHEVVEVHFEKDAFDCDQDIVICDEENYEDRYNCALVFLVSSKAAKLRHHGERVRYFFAPFNAVLIEYEIMQLIKKDLSDVGQLLKKLGVANHLSGYKFIKEAIYLSRKDYKLNEIYNSLATRYNCSTSNIERQIRYTIEKAWLMADLDTCDEIFGNTIDIEKAKPTNKQFIITLAQFT